MVRRIEVSEVQPVSRADLLQPLFAEHNEPGIEGFLRTKDGEIENYRQKIEPAISARLESIFSREESPEQKTGLIWQSFQSAPQDTEFQATHLRLLKIRFLSLKDQPAERQVLLGFGRRLGDAQFTPEERLELLRPILDLDLNVFPEDSSNPYAKLMLKMVSEVDRSGLEEQCCTLVMLSPVQSDLRVGEYLKLRPKVKAKLGEYVENLVGFLRRKTPSPSQLTEGDLRIYTVAAGSAGYRYSGERGSIFDPQNLANSKLRELKAQTEQVGGSGYLLYLDLWRQAVKHASRITRATIINLLTARIKPQSEFFQSLFPPFLDDLLNQAFDDAMAGDTKAKALLNDLVEATQVIESEHVFLPFVDEMAKSGNFSPAKIAFSVRIFLEKMGVIFDQISSEVIAEEICGIFTDQGLSLEVDPEQGVNIIYPDGNKKSVGRIVQTFVQGGETDALREVSDDPVNPQRLLFLQISELLRQDGFDGKSEDEIIDLTDQKWAEIYGPHAHRTKTLSPRGSVLRLFPTKAGRVSPRIEFTDNTQKSNGITLSDLQGALILSDTLRFPFVLAHDGILMDNGGNVFAGLVEYDLGTYLRLNRIVVSRAVDALIDPPEVLMKRADRIARRFNETEAAIGWERRISEQVRAKIPERVLQTGGTRIRQYQDMLFIEHGSAVDYEERKLAAHEISEILNGGEVSMISEERPLTSQDIDQLNIRRGVKITPNLEGKGVRIGSLRWLGPRRRDGSPMLPTLAAIGNVRTNFPNNRLMIRKVYEVDKTEDDGVGGGVRTFAPVTIYSTWQSPVYR